jgi:hypothetical protein
MLFQKKQVVLSEQDIRSIYLDRMMVALDRCDFYGSIAFLNKAIGLLPHDLELRVRRAQIYQYGLNQCAPAVRDYKAVLAKLAERPHDPLVDLCERGISDMMQ